MARMAMSALSGPDQQHFQDVAHSSAHSGALRGGMASAACAPCCRAARPQRGQRSHVVGRRAKQRLHSRLVAKHALEEGQRVGGQRVHGAIRGGAARRIMRDGGLKLAQRGARLGTQRSSQLHQVGQHAAAGCAGQHARQRPRRRLKVLLHVKQPEHLFGRAPRRHD